MEILAPFISSNPTATREKRVDPLNQGGSFNFCCPSREQGPWQEIQGRRRRRVWMLKRNDFDGSGRHGGSE